MNKHNNINYQLIIWLKRYKNVKIIKRHKLVTVEMK